MFVACLITSLSFLTLLNVVTQEAQRHLEAAHSTNFRIQETIKKPMKIRVPKVTNEAAEVVVALFVA